MEGLKFNTIYKLNKSINNYFVGKDLLNVNFLFSYFFALLFKLNRNVFNLRVKEKILKYNDNTLIIIIKNDGLKIIILWIKFYQ